MFAHLFIISWIFVAGFVPFDNTGYTRNDSVYITSYDNSTHIGMEFDALIADHLNVRGSMDSWQYPVAMLNFEPYKIKYDVGAEFYVKPFDEKNNIIISLDRYCYHPVKPWEDTSGYTNGSYFEINIKFKGSADIF